MAWLPVATVVGMAMASTNTSFLVGVLLGVWVVVAVWVLTDWGKP